MPAKYKVYVQKMIDENKNVFDEFKIVHDKYGLDEDKWQDEFNKKGKRVQELTREYEDNLCRNTERGKYSSYSSNLAEKFQGEVRRLFPMYNHIGIKVDEFALNKINL